MLVWRCWGLLVCTFLEVGFRGGFLFFVGFCGVVLISLHLSPHIPEIKLLEMNWVLILYHLCPLHLSNTLS